MSLENERGKCQLPSCENRMSIKVAMIMVAMVIIARHSGRDTSAVFNTTTWWEGERERVWFLQTGCDVVVWFLQTGCDVVLPGRGRVYEYEGWHATSVQHNNNRGRENSFVRVSMNENETCCDLVDQLWKIEFVTVAIFFVYIGCQVVD